MIKSSKLFSNRNRWLWFTIYSLYIVFLLISATAFFAEETINTRASGTYSYELTFSQNGKIEHYDVILENSDISGKIWITYNADSHHLDVQTYNIKELSIDCRSIAEEKTSEILGSSYINNENEYKNYFIGKDLFTVSVEADQEMNIEFKDVPYPEKVILNKITSLSLGEDYSYSSGKISTSVPEGKTDVDIYFKSTAGDDLKALFKTNDKNFYHIPDDTIEFDASESNPPDKIVDYIWDFGDGAFDSRKDAAIDHTYSSPGIYEVTLVIRNSDGLISRITQPLYVFDEDDDGLPDDWEDKFVISSPTDDKDNDGLNNLQEYLRQTNPNNPDTDGDDASDGDEVKAKTDPLDPESKPEETADEEEDKGLLNMGKTIGIDNFLFVIILIIVVIVIVIAIARKGGAEEEEEEAETVLETEEDIEDLDEEEEAYECPDCGSPIFEDQSICTECGATLEWDEEGGEDEEDEEYEEDDDEFEEDELLVDEEEEAPHAGTTKVTQVEEIDDEDDDEEYECPTCGAALKEDDTVCPNCGEEFE